MFAKLHPAKLARSCRGKAFASRLQTSQAASLPLMLRPSTRMFWVSICLCLLSLALPRSAAAHPMGNFSINHFSSLEVRPTFIRVTYVIDMAEIPTFQEMQAHGLNVQTDDAAAIRYREQKVEELRQGLALRVGGITVRLVPLASTLSFPPGAGGLPTLRIAAVYEAPLDALQGEVMYEDRNYAQRVGWKEIIATAHDGATLRTASVPAESKSQQLTRYAEDLIQAPPQDVRATLTFAIPAEARTRALAAPAQATDVLARTTVQTPSTVLTELMAAGQLNTGVILFALLAAVGLGAFHALEPGHGKTLAAAYLVGSHGAVRHACILGLTVTMSHTIGVYALGGIALFASHYIVPEQLYPWLGLASGLLITGTGIFLLGRAVEGRHGDHQHIPDHGHSHDDAPGHTHGHSHDDHHPHAHHGVGYGALVTLGITGGLIPCPAALVVLLSAVALHRIAFGLLLIVAFSVGLAAVLVGTGLLFVSARGLVQRWSGEGRWVEYLPFLSPLVITPLGVVIAVRSLLGTGILTSVSF